MKNIVLTCLCVVSTVANSALPEFTISKPSIGDDLYFYNSEAGGSPINPVKGPIKISNNGDMLSVSLAPAGSTQNDLNYIYSGSSEQVIATLPKTNIGYGITHESFILGSFLTVSQGGAALLRCPKSDVTTNSSNALDFDLSCSTVTTNDIALPISSLYRSRLTTSSGWVATMEGSTTSATYDIVLYSQDNTAHHLGTIPAALGQTGSVYLNENVDGSLSLYINGNSAALTGPPSIESITEFKLNSDFSIATPSTISLGGSAYQEMIIGTNNQVVLLAPTQTNQLAAFTCNLSQVGSCMSPIDLNFSVPNQSYRLFAQVSPIGFFFLTIQDDNNSGIPVDGWIVDYTTSGNFINVKEMILESDSSAEPENFFATTMSENGEKIIVAGGSTLSQANFLGSPSALYILGASIDAPLESTLIVTPEELVINSSTAMATNVDLQLNAQSLFAIEVQCATSNDNITLNSRTAGSVFPAAPQSLLIDTTNLSANTFDQATSLSAYVDSNGAFVSAPEPITASGVYASLVYSVQPVSGTTDVNCTAMGSDAEGLPQTISVTNATITLDNGINPIDGNGQIVSGTVIVPLGVDPSTIVVTLTINDVSVTTTVDANGVFSFENIRMDDVIISVDAPRAVAECTAATVGSEAVSAGDITVYRGDINKDDVIDIADFTYLSSRFGLSEGENRYKAKADLNKDGIINIQDLAILGGALGIAACDPLAN